MKPVNSSVEKDIKASTIIQVFADTIIAKVKVQNAPGNILHKQFIYSGNRCPTRGDDKNSDGFIDWVEAQNVIGKALIPLDGGLASQEEHGGYPTADSAGSYAYERRASLTRLVADLRAPDDDPDDHIGKLKFGEELNMEGRVVVIYGIQPLADMPLSLSSSPEDPAYLALPIACGVLEWKGR
ncbi:MAG TPA: hypothetical protein VNJ08_07960 [Bacteriovoracaceae bacterium]|nr:hypothetical protein [Bacteriovoracaceae bacterium]